MLVRVSTGWGAVTGLLLWGLSLSGPPTGQAHDSPDSRSIDVLEQIELGGVPQWVSIRGEHADNPVLLFLHGGPGDPGIGLSHAFQKAWETDFTVVQWDQRGGGKNSSSVDLRNREVDPDLTIQRLILDSEELVAHLQDRFDTERIFVIGHSWGTILGTHLAKRRPESLHALIAVGHIGQGMRVNESAVYEALLEAARSQGRDEAVAELEALAPYPPAQGPIPPEGMIVRTHWISALGGSLYGEPSGLARYFSAVESSPEYTDEEKTLWPQAASRVIWHLVQDGFFDVDLTGLGYDFDVPVYFFHGAHDLHTPPSNARAYFDLVQAPDKGWFTFTSSAHSPHFEEPGLFLERLGLVAQRIATLRDR